MELEYMIFREKKIYFYEIKIYDIQRNEKYIFYRIEIYNVQKTETKLLAGSKYILENRNKCVSDFWFRRY